jgi:hypothetical protein
MNEQDDTTSNTFDAEFFRETANVLWDPQLTQQLRALLHADRLLSLQSRDEHRPPEFQHYASLSLALKLFDLIITNTGLGQDIEHSQAIEELLPLLGAMDREAGIEPERARAVRMAERVLATLYNEKEQREPFKLDYTTFEQGEAVRRTLSVRLLEERHHVDGRTVLRLSNECANLLLNALTVNLEDAQVAAEAIIEWQLKRGRIQEARGSAQWALQHSIRLREHIERRLLDTRRDLHSVDWREEMRHMLDDALLHVRTRCIVEHSIVATAREQFEQLETGSRQAYQLAEIMELIETCRQQHLMLERRLMEAPRIFFEEQERQIFTLRSPLLFPHPQNDLLAPLLSLPRVLVVQTLDTIVSACFPASAPGIFSLARYLHYLLQPRRETQVDSVPIPSRELIDMDYDQTRFTAEMIERAEHYLAALAAPKRLSELVLSAQEAGEPIAVIEVLVFLVMDYFDEQDSPEQEKLPVFVLKTDTQQFWLSTIAGDDVVVCPKQNRKEH